MEFPLPMLQFLGSHILLIGAFLMVKNIKQRILFHILVSLLIHDVFLDERLLARLQLDRGRRVIIRRQHHVILAVLQQLHIDLDLPRGLRHILGRHQVNRHKVAKNLIDHVPHRFFGLNRAHPTPRTHSFSQTAGSAGSPCESSL